MYACRFTSRHSNTKNIANNSQIWPLVGGGIDSNSLIRQMFERGIDINLLIRPMFGGIKATNS